jgi:hypothetical protein
MRITALVCSLILSCSAIAQNSDLFDRKEQAYMRHGWSWKLGAHVLSASPSNSQSQWLIANTAGTLDTLHTGSWEHQGSGSALLGIGHWWVTENPVIWDRWSLEVVGVRHGINSEFQGQVGTVNPVGLTSPDTLIDFGQSDFTLQTAIQVHRAIEILPDFFLDTQIGIGWNREFGMISSRTGADSTMFLPPSAPSKWRLAFEGGVGFGVRTRSGRYLRVLVNTDLIQLKPTANQGGGAWDWMESSYRPWQFMVSWDLQKKRAAASCVGAPQGKPGRNLFDSKMRKKMSWSRGR